MSYCVNCGVELSDNEKKCPLCMTEVINPKKPYAPTEKRNYPNTPVFGYKSGYRGLLAPLALLMLIPVVICITANILTSGEITWSGYIVISILLSWLYIFPPLAAKKARPLLYLSLDIIGAAVFLYYVNLFSGGDWFFGIALPLTVTVGVIVFLLTVLFIRVPMLMLNRAAVTLFSAAVLAGCIEYVLDLRYVGHAEPDWSVYVIITLCILSLCCLLLSRNKKLKERARRTLHF